MDERKNQNFKLSVIILLVSFLLCIVPILFMLAKEIITENKQLLEINKIEENHEKLTFYLDGKEVDFDKIDINLYQISYDMESGKVFLTK